MTAVKTGVSDFADADGVTTMHTKDAAGWAIEAVLAADPSSEDGRSQWVWIRLPNGDLVLALYPQGDTYFETEEDHSS
jgi:hypothetical protein